MASAAAKETAPGDQDSAPEIGVLLPSKRAVSRHTLTTPTRAIEYQATAASLTIHDEKGEASGRIFYIAYTADDSESARRPLTFVFNGGPGAASAYLHLGALGPQRVVFNDDGTVPPRTPRLEGNPLSWLAFTDLVFVDPIGTGYSRMIPAEAKEATRARKAKSAKAKTHDESPWGVAEDARFLARFIRLYLTREERWLSPVYLAAESYGGFRVARLAKLLQSEFGIEPGGLVMISPALEFGLLWGGEHGLLSWAALLPTYAAVAAFHDRSDDLPEAGKDIRTRLATVEDYALSGLLMGLARADAAESDLWKRLAGFTGLDRATVRRFRGRIPPERLAKTLLADRRRLVSLYDGSITLIDPDPASSVLGERDPYLTRINAVLTPTFNSYIQDGLGFKTDLRYRLLNEEVFESWNWRSGFHGQQGYAGVIEQLRTVMSLNPALRLWIVHGVYDLVTPYFGSVIAVNQMGLDPAVRENVRIDVYQGGHMLYFRRDSREKMYQDAQRFYRDSDQSP
ncbi:MAG: alpha/beta hydrolase [Methylohalobius crimeensis]